MILIKLTNRDYTGTEEYFNRAVNFIYLNEKEFDISETNLKVTSVKFLKRETGGCLKDCKNICTLYWEGKILNKKEIRLQKIKKIENVL